MSDATVREPSLHPLLAAVLFLVLVMKPLGDLGLLPHAEGFFAGLLVAFIASLLGILRGSGWLRWIIPVIGLLAVLLQGWSTHIAPGELRFAAVTAASFMLLAVCAGIMRHVLAPGRVTLRRIEAAVIAYMLIGLIFAGIYDIEESLSPGSFAGDGYESAQPRNHGDFIFFSFVTLTSTGYGDFIPVHPIARSLAIFEAMCGQFFVAVVLARLVSLEIAGRREE
jgi:Ion channel